MEEKYLQILKKKLAAKEIKKLIALDNPSIISFVAEYVELCNPKSVFVCDDSPKDLNYIRKQAIKLGEEKKLKKSGQTIHFDGILDQARDKDNTRFLLSQGRDYGTYMNGINRQDGEREIKALLSNIMQDKEMFISFFCQGPVNSEFSLLAVQITDSSYVIHSENILYRPGYNEFKRKKGTSEFFSFVHSAGELENSVCKNIDKRRLYIDLEKNLVYSVNTQYAGNSVGLKKLALRLSINKAYAEGWLAEHMFTMAVKDLKGKKAYFCGAYPSMCGKTSTAMMEGESIVGDDITYLRVINGEVFAVNVEKGIFGIIKDINAKDDPLLYNALAKAKEVIFSNVLMDDKGLAYWVGKGEASPHKGINFSGEWFPGKTDKKGKEITASHKNARFTLPLKVLENVDQNLESPEGVPIKAIIYGGRDSDTWVPVEQSFSWEQGIITKGASLESETTAATLGQEGMRSFDPMSNMDFLSISLGKYIGSNIAFGNKAKKQPLIFSVNYFLRNKEGKFLNSIKDKRVWFKWMRLRIDNKVKALESATGLIPKYEDLVMLFKKILKKDYSKEEYIQQFTLRIPENLAKIERLKNIYKGLKDIPKILFVQLEAQESRLKKYQKDFGDYVSPFKLK